MDRRIWVDFSDKPSDEHLFRLRVTTINQPFGFQKAEPSTKLSLGDRRNARDAFVKEFKIEKPSHEFLFAHAKPYGSKQPIDLNVLIESWKQHKGNKAAWLKEIQVNLEQNGKDGIESEKLRITKFADALERLFKLQIPLIKVDHDFFSADADADEASDPPLAVLFKRIGTGGTPLSDADYVYSVIKHHLPQTYRLVEDLHSKGNIASLLSSTDLVMTAVRLAAAENNPATTDWESPTKQEFHRLIKHEGFLTRAFLPLIESDVLNVAFASLTELLAFDKKKNSRGLPSHAFPLLNRPLVQVLLRWIHNVQRRELNNLNAVLEQSRNEILRFVMYWQLCVIDPKKASRIAFKQLNNASDYFPGKEIYSALIKEQLGIQIISPKTILDANRDVAFTDDSEKFALTKLRGWKRFDIPQQATEIEKCVVLLYQRWWGNGRHYTHPLLLWLQREIVAKFEGSPVAGRDEDTPYDYDHICPANHWGGWTGIPVGDRLIDFLAENKNGGQSYLGNSIGNVRVWDSSQNRSDGEDAPSKKLDLDNPNNRDELLKQSAIDPQQIIGWKICSGEEEKVGIHWSEKRVQGFQQVVEQRAFALYERYYNELEFSVWPETLISEDA
jgi:hypothetical protein